MPKIKMPTTLFRDGELSFDDAVERFLIDCSARGLADKTLFTYRHHFQGMAHYLDMAMPLRDLRREHLNMMVVEMRANKLATNTISSYVRVITTFLHWCDREQLCHVEPPKFKQVETVKETYTDEELLTLLKRPSPTCRFTIYRNWVIINFLLNCGCRASSLRNIQNQDVFLDEQKVIFRHNKNGKVQAVPLCHQMVVILQEYKIVRGGTDTDFLFCDEFGNQLSESALREGIARYNRSRGVRKTSCHLFRHTFARKYLIDCNGNAFTLQHLLGHSTLKMTQHYCKVFDADIAKNFDNFSPLAQITQSKSRIHNRK